MKNRLMCWVLALGFCMLSVFNVSGQKLQKLDSAISTIWVTTYPDSQVITDTMNYSYSIATGDFFVVKIEAKAKFYGVGAKDLGPMPESQFILLQLNSSDKVVSIDNHGESLIYDGAEFIHDGALYKSVRLMEAHQEGFAKIGDYYAENMGYGWRLLFDHGYFQFGGLFEIKGDSRKFSAVMNLNRDWGFTPPSYSSKN